MGLSDGRVLRQVELPIALPLHLGSAGRNLAGHRYGDDCGLRRSGGLGRFLIDGLATGDYAATAGGALLVAVLALLVDLLLAGVVRLLVSPGLTGKQSRRRRLNTICRRPSRRSPTRRDPELGDPRRVRSG